MRLFHRIRQLFRRRRFEAEMAEEMRFHLEQRAADFANDGFSDAEARHAAHRKFGALGNLQEQARDARGWGALERFLKDLRFGFRQLARSPGFTLLALVTLSLGIGANTAMFNVLKTVWLKPLPYPDGARLDRIYRANAQNPQGDISPAEFLELQTAQAGYGEFAAYAIHDASVAEPGQPAELLNEARVSTNFLSLLGTKLPLGRAFLPGESVPGRDRVVILSQRLWRNRFDRRADIIGRSLRIDGEPHEIVGVLPETFNDWRHLGWVDFLRPLVFDLATSTDRSSSRLGVIGRRANLVTPADGAGFIENFGRRQAAAHPAEDKDTSWHTKRLLASAIGSKSPVILAMLIGLSGFVLLIACSNLANLLLVRAVARSREFAVRAALGASRLQLLRPLAAESLLLALAGSGGALLVAEWAGHWLAAHSGGDNGERILFALDWRVFGWAVGASLATALAFGLAPALFALRLDLNDTLKSGGRAAAGDRRHRRFRQLLIVGQFALALVLLAGAGLFVGGLHELNNRGSGWDATHLVTGTVHLPPVRYSNPEKVARFHRFLLERVEALPGVEAAGIASAPPFFTWPELVSFVIQGREAPERGREPGARLNVVSPRYFDAVRTPLLAGRAFTANDTATSAKVFIVSQSTARRWFGSENPLGQRIAPASGEQPAWGEVVGVVEDVYSAGVESQSVAAQIYRPLSQDPRSQFEIALRTGEIAPATLVGAVRQAIARLDPDLPVRQLMTADERIRRNNYSLGVFRDVISSFAILGLALASLGIYGVVARTVAQRTSEFAVRLALGARTADLARIVLLSGAKLALAGATLGGVGAFGLSRLFGSIFPGMPLRAGVILPGTTLLLVALALLACWLPARRAAKVDAMSALRAD